MAAALRCGRAGNPDGGALLERLSTRTLPEGWADTLPVWDADPKGVATRKASGEVLAALYPVLPELWGGSGAVGADGLLDRQVDGLRGDAGQLQADVEIVALPVGVHGHSGGPARGPGAAVPGPRPGPAVVNPGWADLDRGLFSISVAAELAG